MCRPRRRLRNKAAEAGKHEAARKAAEAEEEQEAARTAAEPEEERKGQEDTLPRCRRSSKLAAQTDWDKHQSSEKRQNDRQHQNVGSTLIRSFNKLSHQNGRRPESNTARACANEDMRWRQRSRRRGRRGRPRT